MSRLSRAVSFESSGAPGDDPRPTLELVDAYLDQVSRLPEGGGRRAAAEAQLAAIARAVIARVGLESALVRSGRVLIPVDDGEMAALIPFAAVDLDVQAERDFEATVLRSVKLLAAGHRLERSESHAVRQALYLVADCDRDEAGRLMSMLARGPAEVPFDMAGFAALARAQLEADRAANQPRLAPGTDPRATDPETAGDSSPDSHPETPGEALDRTD